MSKEYYLFTLIYKDDFLKNSLNFIFWGGGGLRKESSRTRFQTYF